MMDKLEVAIYKLLMRLVKLTMTKSSLGSPNPRHLFFYLKLKYLLQKTKLKSLLIIGFIPKIKIVKPLQRILFHHRF